MYLIGIDIGTTNTKAVAFTRDGKVLASANATYSPFTDTEGRHELDPGELFGAVIQVLGEVLTHTSTRQGLAGISFSAAMHSLLAVDREGVPLTKAITWADLRSHSYAEALRGTEAGKRIYRQTGTPIHAMSPLCKLLWLRDREPGIFQQAAKFISIKEYIWWKLFGKYQVDYSIASATGLFDIYAFDWYKESLERAGIGSERLSIPVPSTQVETAVTPSLAAVLRLPMGVPFVIGGSDGCLANLGSLAVKPGETALTIGTSGAIRMTTPAPTYDPRERIFNYILTKDYYIAGGATNNGGGVVQWFIEHFLGKGAATPEEIQAFAEEAASAPPGSEGLVFLPYLQGERAPVWDADAKGVLYGIRSIHQQRHFMRAVLEGVSYSLYQIGLSLEETIGPIRHIYASGGFTRSKTWLQLLADIFNRKVYVTGVADASAIGAVVLGWYALGMAASLEEPLQSFQIAETYEPDPARHLLYRKNFEIYSVLYDRLKDLEKTKRNAS